MIKKGITETDIKKLYNARYNLKKIKPNSKILNKKPSTLKNKKEYYNYYSRIEHELFNARLKKNLNSPNKRVKKQAYNTALDLYKYTNPVKFARTVRNYEKEFNPYEYKKNKRKLDRAVETALEKQRNSNYVRNNYGLRVTRGQRDNFYIYRNRYNKKKQKLLNELKTKDPKLFDYIMGINPKGMPTGKMIVEPQIQFSEKDITNFSWLRNKIDYNEKMTQYVKFLQDDMNFYTWAEQQKQRVFQIFKTGKFEDVSNTIMNKIWDKAKNMDMQTFQMWYSNNKDKVKAWYLMAKYETTVTVQDLEVELENILTEIDQYSVITREYYGY